MAAKIKDGLFIGDAETSQSEVFINDNKISNLINLSGREVSNIWASHGLVYLTYNWEDRPDFRLFSGQDDDILTSIVEFVDVSIAHGISVLLFSKRGTGRCVIAACLYLMMKHRWGFEKSYDYVYSKKPDIDLNKGFIQQMFALDMKLLAARQKAYALKHGIENGFRIEPSMTINDIAAMLPPVEAKRWNSWDPNYILNPNLIINETGGANQLQIQQPQDEDHVTWPKFADSVSTALKKKDSLYTKVMTNKQKVTFRVMDEAEEELVLIFSFLNSKNTISSLPGPYHNVYDTHKAFKLKFDNVIFEEDVNWFPSSPVNPRYNYTPRGILKGVPKRHHQQQAAQGQPLLLPPSSSSTTASASAMIPPFESSSSTAAGKRNMATFEPAEDKMAYRNNSYEYQPGHPHHQQSQQSATADDLYKYVGLGGSAEAKVVADQSNSSSLRSSRDEKKGYPESGGGGPPDSQWTMEDDRANAGMSAEERLRKLMADMQRQNHFPDHLRPPGHGASHGGHGHGQPPHHHQQPQQQQAKAESGAEDHYYSVNNPSISLHELANMPVQATTTTVSSDGRERRGGERERDSKGLPAPSSHRLDKNQSEISVIDMEKDDFSTSMMMKQNSDPLAAFDLPMPKHSSAMPNTASASSQQAQKGALRARHDILGSSSAAPGNSSSSGNKAPLMPNQTRTSLTRQAWNNPPPPGSSSSAGSSSSMNRPPSPMNRPASPTTARGVSSNSSVGSQGSGVGGGNFVGTGSTTSQKVYR
jgi:hypothetical protein